MQEAIGETPTMQGHVTIEAVYDDGTRKTLVDRSNQIVNGYLLAVSNLLTQKDTELSPEQYAVNSLWVEASDTAYVEGVTPADTLESIDAQIVKRYVFDRESDVDLEVDGDPGLVEFRARLERGEANDETIRGVGLYSQGDDAQNPDTAQNVLLLARQIVGAIPKNSDFALEFTWRVQTSID